MTDQDKQNIAAVRKAYQEGTDVIADNVVWHVPGHNPVSGTYRGIKAYLQDMVAKMAPIDEWIVDVESVMVNGNMAVTQVRVRGLRKNHRVDLAGAHVMRLENGKVVEGWGFVEDQDVLDQFFSA
jgi:ketosteroid isomerase-like protein